MILHNIQTKNFDWVVVDIDDRLPCSPDGRILFAKCPDKDEFWVPLVEKGTVHNIILHLLILLLAYAKLHGGYQNIESGTITDGIYLFSAP